jgi:hypothetical protein
MDYQKQYNLLIDKYKKLNLHRLNPIEQNFIAMELHHIIPRCLNGSNEKDNLVMLTSKAHFVAHHLLYKANVNTKYKYKLLKAYAMMLFCEDKRTQNRKFRITSKVYQNLKNEYSIINSIEAKQRWENLSEDEKRIHIARNHTKETNEKRRITCSKVKKTDEWNEKNRLAHLGKTHSKNRINNIKKGLKRFWSSLEGESKKRELSQKHKGRKTWNKGIPRIPEERKKMSEGRIRNHQLRKLCKILDNFIKRSTSGNN